MRHPSCLAALLVLAVALPSSALAQQAPAEGDDGTTITVTGNRDVRETIRDFVGALTPGRSSTPLAKFERQVCPRTIGLAPRLGDAVTQRMRRVAEAANIRVAGPKCVPNVVVVVTRDKQAFLQALDRQKDTYFDGIPLPRVRALLRDPSSATAWQLNGPPVSANGMEIWFNEVTQRYENRTTEATSRLKSPARPQFEAAVVVIDAKAIEGLSVTQLADYAALRAYTNADPKRLPADAPASILKVIDAPADAEVPLSMTAWDLGFLRGLYTAPPNNPANAQRSAIGSAVEREVAKPRE